MRGILFLLVVAIVSCNSNNQETKANEHAGHNMPAAAAGYADSVNAGLIIKDTLKGSPHRVAMANVGDTHVHLEYNSPGVKGRTIWGGLVAWDQVWVAGAHAATQVRFYKDVIIEGKTIPANTYAFFLLPKQGKWVIILNSRYQQHLTDEYNPAEDVVRVETEPLENSLTERLTYKVEPINETEGKIVFMWEKVKVELPVRTVDGR